MTKAQKSLYHESRKKTKIKGENMKPILEICCGSAEDGLIAFAGGADRIELNCALELGGLTPSLGSLLEIKSRVPQGKIMAMVRPRPGNFLYSEREYAAMKRDGELLLLSGADGLVFGFLREDGSVDMERTAYMAGLAQRAGKEAVFHRAIDMAPDWKKGLDALMEAGITRVLTSGQRPTAIEGAETLRQMQIYAAGRLEILPGCGVREHNLEALLQYTGCYQVHMSAHRQKEAGASPTEVSFGGYKQADRDLVQAAAKACRRYIQRRDG